MEARIVPPHGFALETIDFSGVRGKGLATLALLPLRLLRAFWQAWCVVRRVQPDVVVGLGGYITFPGGMMGAGWQAAGAARAELGGRHGQQGAGGRGRSRVHGLSRRCSRKGSGWATRCALPSRARRRRKSALPAARAAAPAGGGRQPGARAQRHRAPGAGADPADQRPVVTHQSGAAQIELRANYEAAGVQAELTPFIEDTASAFAQADIIVCRAGASTVTEIAAVGAAAVFVPFPAAVDDHQTTNASSWCRPGVDGWCNNAIFLPKAWPKCYKIQSVQR
jgi:UDP-N-acetylglucosamine--N-acetylmuramyl-(pentapeptide) pyrophosphoryl-undecaprenol N-acetylglucosamine transferase